MGKIGENKKTKGDFAPGGGASSPEEKNHQGGKTFLEKKQKKGELLRGQYEKKSVHKCSKYTRRHYEKKGGGDGP